jgi:hypothetical protein
LATRIIYSCIDLLDPPETCKKLALTCNKKKDEWHIFMQYIHIKFTNSANKIDQVKMNKEILNFYLLRRTGQHRPPGGILWIKYLFHVQFK